MDTFFPYLDTSSRSLDIPSSSSETLTQEITSTKTTSPSTSEALSSATTGWINVVYNFEV